MDKCALGFNEPTDKVGTVYDKPKPSVASAKPSALRARFENMAKQSEEDALNKVREERERRLKVERREREADTNRNDVSAFLFMDWKMYVGRCRIEQSEYNLLPLDAVPISNSMKDL